VRSEGEEEVALDAPSGGKRPPGGGAHAGEGRLAGSQDAGAGSNPGPLRMDRGEAKGELVDSFRLATASPAPVDGCNPPQGRYPNQAEACNAHSLSSTELRDRLSADGKDSLHAVADQGKVRPQ
jgi:hypothetical protein